MGSEAEGGAPHTMQGTHEYLASQDHERLVVAGKSVRDVNAMYMGRSAYGETTPPEGGSCGAVPYPTATASSNAQTGPAVAAQPDSGVPDSPPAVQTAPATSKNGLILAILVAIILAAWLIISQTN